MARKNEPESSAPAPDEENRPAAQEEAPAQEAPADEGDKAEDRPNPQEGEHKDLESPFTVPSQDDLNPAYSVDPVAQQEEADDAPDEDKKDE